MDVGLQHREFFRVKLETEEKRAHVSLIARNAQDPVSSDNGDDPKPILPPETTAKLMVLAVDLHAKQVHRREAWKPVVIPIIVAVLSAVTSISAALISVGMRKC